MRGLAARFGAEAEAEGAWSTLEEWLRAAEAPPQMELRLKVDKMLSQG